MKESLQEQHDASYALNFSSPAQSTSCGDNETVHSAQSEDGAADDGDSESIRADEADSRVGVDEYEADGFVVQDNHADLGAELCNHVLPGQKPCGKEPV